MRKIISVLSFVSMLVLLSCNGSKESKNELSTELAHYVSGFTSGLLSCEAQVQVDLLDAYQGEMPEDMLLPKGVFSIEPHIAGKAVWRNRKTIAFVPDDKWESGQNYTIKVDLSKLIDIPQDLKILVFDVDIFILSFQVKEEGLQAYDRGSSVWQRYKGSISTSDVVSNEKLEQILEAKSSDGADLPISWLHADNGLTHYFSVDSVKRLKDESEMLLSWNGAAIGVDDKGEQAVLVPAFGDFKLLKTEVMQQPQQYISLRFSDPLKKNQDFRGLFRLDNDSQLKVVIDGNETRIYPSKRMLGEKELKISKSVRNVDDIPLKKDE